MAFQIINSDITTLNVDAIVNPTDQFYSGGGGLDMQIHDICGQPLRDATNKLPRLHLGEAKATGCCQMPWKNIGRTRILKKTGVKILKQILQIERRKSDVGCNYWRYSGLSF